jgi:hypothetical protein
MRLAHALLRLSVSVLSHGAYITGCTHAGPYSVAQGGSLLPAQPTLQVCRACTTLGLNW